MQNAVPIRYVCPACTHVTFFDVPTHTPHGKHCRHFDWCQLQRLATGPERTELARWLRCRLAVVVNNSSPIGD